MLERLQKIISRAGITSRRHAEELILSGQVRVNGVVITELGVKADPDRDKIEAAGKVATISESRAYVLLHKPPQIVSTIADPEGRRTVRDLLVGVSERVFPVGRLDYAASGVVFLTSDGDLASRPPNPWYQVQFSGVRRDLLRRNLLNMGHRVEKMKRVKLASLEAETVPEGHYRRLDATEVAKLSRAIDRALENKPPLPSAPKDRHVRRRRPK